MRPRRAYIITTFVVTMQSLSLLTGCGDDNPVSPQDRLIGTWNCTKYELTEDGVTVDVLDTILDSFAFTFARSGRYSAVTAEQGQAPITMSGTYSATSSTITIDTGTVEITFDYSISDSVLTMTGADGGLEYDMSFVKA